jgi:hypothetical protein
MKSWDSSKAWSWKFSKIGFGTTLTIVKQTQAINQQNATNMCYMNGQKESGNDSENFDTRITGFGVVV